jgi:DNA-directed RNA polymerase specialized sigma24 family protein
MSSSRIKVVKGLPATYKKQRTKFTAVHLRNAPLRLFTATQYELLDHTISTPGISYETLALHYSLPIGTVKSRLSRARAVLNKHLEAT